MNKLLHLASVFLFVTTLSPFCFACWSSGPRGMNPDDKKVWNGWDPPSGAKDAWVKWTDEWKKRKESGGHLTEEDVQSGKSPAGYGIKGWPPEWKGLQSGFGGMAPPPWSYIPKNVGKPPKCYEPPDAGHCKDSYLRYGYNPYTDECSTFQYSGCGGNLNNFASKLRCEQDCINPIGGCEPPNSDIPSEDIKWLD